MSEPSQYILEGWDDICATANASLDSDCPLLDDEVLVEMHKYLGQLRLNHDQQIQELEAQVERLREGLLTLMADEHGALSNDGARHVNLMLDETPAQSLAEIKAAAIDEAILLLVSRITTVRSKMIIKDAIWALRCYAKQLREGR